MNKKKIGFRVLITSAIILNIFYLIGLQEPVEDITAIGVALNKGFGFGDTVIYMPLFIAGIIGLLLKRTWGYIGMVASLGITIYWPTVCMAVVLFARGSEGWYFNDYSSYAILLGLIAIYGAWGLAYLCMNRQHLMVDKTDIALKNRNNES